jgi:hypothetical protein
MTRQNPVLTGDAARIRGSETGMKFVLSRCQATTKQRLDGVSAPFDYLGQLLTLSN